MHFKVTEEQNAINFNSSNTEYYNKEFTYEELNYSLSKTRNTTPGIGGIGYQMLKHMLKEAKFYLVRIFNHLWRQSYFPRDWKTAIIIPILKPGKIITKVKVTSQSP